MILYRHIGYERVYLSLHKVADTPFHIQCVQFHSSAGVVIIAVKSLDIVTIPFYDIGGAMDANIHGILPCKSKRRYPRTCKASRYCLIRALCTRLDQFWRTNLHI